MNDEKKCFRERVFGPSVPREEVMRRIYESPSVYPAFERLSESLREEFVSFCMGVRGLNITYDPVFKRIFDPEAHASRLEDFLSCCLGQEVRILSALPTESTRLTEEGSLLVMDLLVRLASGALVNIEIQRIGYLFPGQRCACYSSDLVMRQYTRVREECRRQKKAFSYKDIKKVYTIVLIQDSTKEFHLLPEAYVHRGKNLFDTGLKLDMLQEYILIPLDIFWETVQNKDRIDRLDGWLTFIGTDKPEDILWLIERYPEFEEIYREVFRFRYQMEELMHMYSEALSVLDANTVKYMVERQQEEIAQQKNEIDKLKREREQQSAEIARLKALLEAKPQSVS